MRQIWTKAQLEEALGEMITVEGSFGKLEFNSKDLLDGDIFIALPGSSRDGHEFIEDALAKEASLIISQKNHQDKRVIRVPDTMEALNKLAKYKRSNSQAKFIGVTGSVGKTSTKEMLGFLLSNFGETFYNKASFNNHIGVPLSLSSISDEIKYSINEMGMNHSGEIRELTKLVRPHMAIITTIGEAHLENLGSVENICKAKCEIFEGLEGESIAIINKDNSYFNLQKDILSNLGVKNIYSFGESEDADASMLTYRHVEGINKVKYRILGREYQFDNKLYGKHQSVNLASVLLGIKLLGNNLELINDKIAELESYSGRGKFHSYRVNGKNITFIDDAYNANPVSMKASLSTLKEYDLEKYVILADMKELGEDEVILHRNLKQDILNAKVTKVFSIGNLMKNLYGEIKSDLFASHFEDSSKETFESIISGLDRDSIILVKGSNSTKIRDIFDYLNSNFEMIK